MASCPSAGDEQDDHAGAGARRDGRVVEDRHQRAGRRGARGALGDREDATAPVDLRRGVVVRADDDDRAALAEVEAELGRAGEDVPAVGDRTLEQRAQEAGLGLLGLALRRAEALHLGRDERQHHGEEAGRRRPAAQAHAQPSDDLAPDAQLLRVDTLAVGQQRALVGGRAGGDGEHRARVVEQDHRRLERPRRGADDLGQAGAGRDGLADRLERLQSGSGTRRRRRVTGCHARHPSWS
jgi:hypothetical protein